MPGDDFNYGERQEDGQFENHPTIDEGEFVQPVRTAYIHDEGCGDLTRMGKELARSVARAPDYYDATFCASCGDYFPVEEFRWRADGKPWNMQRDDNGGETDE